MVARQAIAGLRGKALIGASTAAVLVLVGCSGAASDNDASPSTEGRQTLTYVQAEDIHNFDPSQVPFGNVVLNYQLFDSLIEMDGEEPAPALATNWEVSDDQTEITFNLRDDVLFHDGTAFTAEHVEFNIER